MYVFWSSRKHKKKIEKSEKTKTNADGFVYSPSPPFYSVKGFTPNFSHLINHIIHSRGRRFTHKMWLLELFSFNVTFWALCASYVIRCDWFFYVSFFGKRLILSFASLEFLIFAKNCQLSVSRALLRILQQDFGNRSAALS